MHIFLICQQTTEQYSVPAFGFWRYYLLNGLKEENFTISEPQNADWAYGLQVLPPDVRTQWLHSVWETSLKEIKSLIKAGKSPDLILTYLFPNQIEPSALKDLVRLGIPVVNFFCDNVREFEKVPTVYSDFTLHWVPEYKALSMYAKAGLKTIFLPMPMWVSPEYRQPADTENGIINFTGSRDRLRTALFNNIAGKCTNLEIRGSGWLQEKSEPKSGSFHFSSLDKLKLHFQFIREQGLHAWYKKRNHKSIIPDLNESVKSHIKAKPDADAYIRLTRESMITLGVNRYPSWNFPDANPDTYSRLRDLEAPMLGACYLTEYTEGLEELFDIETDIRVWKTNEELLQQIEILSKDVDLRKKLRLNAQKKALENFSVGQSVRHICINLNLKL